MSLDSVDRKRQPDPVVDIVDIDAEMVRVVREIIETEDSDVAANTIAGIILASREDEEPRPKLEPGQTLRAAPPVFHSANPEPSSPVVCASCDTVGGLALNPISTIGALYHCTKCGMHGRSMFGF